MKHRSVETKIWDDSWFSDLDPIEKLLFVYLITNSRATLCGIYELPIKTMSLETGIEKEMVSKILKRFEVDGKIAFKSGFVSLKNSEKYQSDSPKIKIAIENEKKALPSDILSHFTEVWIGYAYHIDTISESRVEKSRVEESRVDYRTEPIGSGKKQQEQPRSKEPRTEYKTKTQPSEVVRFIEMFSAVNPMYKVLFRQVSQRRAIDDLLDVLSVSELESIIKSLPAVNAKIYTKITTPCQLVANLGKAQSQLKTEIQKEQKSIRQFV